MRISDWSSDVCSSDLVRQRHVEPDLQIVGRLPVDVDADLIGRDVAIVILDDLVDEAADIALIDGFAAGLDTVHDAAALDDLFDQRAARDVVGEAGLLLAETRFGVETVDRPGAADRRTGRAPAPGPPS